MPSENSGFGQARRRSTFSRSGSVLLCLLLPALGCLTVERSVLTQHGNRVRIPMVTNKTLEYGAEELLTDVLVTHFARDGRIVVVDTAPDLILEATLTEYHLAGFEFDEDDRIVGKRLTVKLQAGLVSAQTGAVIFPARDFESSGTFYALSQPDLRRQSDVFLRLSQAMISSMVEGW